MSIISIYGHIKIFSHCYTLFVYSFIANVNIRTFNDHQTPLHYAAKYNSVDALKVLVGHGGDIQAQDVMKRTPLFVAAEYGECVYITNIQSIKTQISVI